MLLWKQYRRSLIIVMNLLFCNK